MAHHHSGHLLHRSLLLLHLGLVKTCPISTHIPCHLVSCLSNLALEPRADLPPLMFQRHIRPVLATLSPDPITGASPAAASEMHRVLTKMTGFYSRYYWSEEGEKSSRWLRDEIAKVSLARTRGYDSIRRPVGIDASHRFEQPKLNISPAPCSSTRSSTSPRSAPTSPSRHLRTASLNLRSLLDSRWRLVGTHRRH